MQKFSGMPLKLLLVDAIYPAEWLVAARKERPELAALSFQDYEQWLKDSRLFFTSALIPEFERMGFNCKTFIATDVLFLQKLHEQLAVNKARKTTPGRQGYKQKLKSFLSLSPMHLFRYIKPTIQQKRDAILRRLLDSYQPDIIFVREPTGIDTSFWNRYRHRSLVTALIGCNTSHPNNWRSHNYDVIFSLTPEYQQFFKVQGIPSYMFSYGVDGTLFRELSQIVEKKYAVSFVGLLGTPVQRSKTILMERIAGCFEFSWWGPCNVDVQQFPFLYRSYRGMTSGLEMLKIYRQSKIVINDYVETANGAAVNLRLYEVLSSGSFLLTRRASDLERRFPGDIVAMYESADECIRKVSWYLEHEIERECQAESASKFAQEHYSYAKQMTGIAESMRSQFFEKHSDKSYGTTS